MRPRRSTWTRTWTRTSRRSNREERNAPPERFGGAFLHRGDLHGTSTYGELALLVMMLARRRALHPILCTTKVQTSPEVRHMSSIAQLARHASAVAMTCIGFAALSPLAVRAQEMTGPERTKMEEILHGVRGEIAKSYYDSTFGGMNLSAVYDSAASL